MRHHVFTAFVILAPMLGCARPAGPLFPEVHPPIVFPPPPDPPRVTWLGQFRAASDLRPGVSGWDAFRHALAGTPPDTSISAPSGLAISDGERLYVTDPPLRCVHVFDLRARTYRAITHAGPTPLAAPADVAVADGRVFVTDAGRAVIDVFREDGPFVATWSGLRLVRPVGIVYAAESRRLYVVDAGGHACVGLSLDGSEEVRFGGRGSGAGDLNFPTFAAFDPRLGLVISDSLNFRVQCFDAAGVPLATFGRKGDAAGDFALPKGVAIDEAQRIYVADAHFENIQIFDSQGGLLLALGGEGQAPGQFWLPSKIAIDGQRRLWVADSYNRRVQVFRLLTEPSV
jgi:DNA-binding beta-propeller fold protein YncE